MIRGLMTSPVMHAYIIYMYVALRFKSLYIYIYVFIDPEIPSHRREILKSNIEI